jgi:DNA polymerase-3 subunit gamma/tau
VLGGASIDEDVIASLIGTGRTDVQYALGDAVAVGDAKGVFELVNSLVQEGQDLRHVTNEVLAHFRNLLLAKTAPGQPDLLDATDDEAERINAQASKYSAPELARVISLLLAAQTDMRWTTSPRLSLELALIRSTIPEADERPEALVSRLERLERIAGLSSTVGSGVAAPGSRSAAPSPSDAAPASASAAPQEPSATTPAPKRGRRPAAPPADTDAGGGGAGPEASSSPPADESTLKPPAAGKNAGEGEARGPTPTPPRPAPPAAPVLGAGTSAVDVAMLRGSWATVIQHLRSQGKAVLPSFLEIATPAAFDGQTLELVFPPDRPFGVTKVEEREDELRQALQELFGIAPVIRCVIREPAAGPVDVEVDPPLSEEEALARLTSELGATPSPVSEDG